MQKSDLNNNHVRVVSGMLHRGLESRLFEQIISIKQDNPLDPVIVLVGSRLLAQYLAGYMVKNCRDIFNVRFVTFADLIRECSLAAQMDDGRPVLPKIGKRAIISEIIVAARDENYFSKVLERTGFQCSLTSTFNEIDDSGVEFSEDNSTKQLPNQWKWTSLQKMFKLYRQILCKFKESYSEVTKIKDISQVFARVFQSQNLFVYGFYDFAQGQFNVIEALSKNISIEMLIPYWDSDDDFGSAFQYASSSYKEFIKLGSQEDNILIHQKSGILSGFGSRLFRHCPGESEVRFKPDGLEVGIIKGLDVTNEILKITGKINELTLYKDFGFDDIGILIWHPEIYKNAVCCALKKAGIPYYDAIGTSLSESQEGRTTLELLKLISHKIKRRDLVDLISTYKIRFSVQGGERESDTVIWEKISNSTSIIEGGRENWDKTLEWIESSSDNIEDRYQTGLFRGFIKRLFDCFDEIPTNGTYLEFISGVSAYLAEFLTDSDTKAQILRIITDMTDLNQISKSIKIQVFIDLIIESLGSASVKMGNLGSGVAIFDKMTGRGVAFDVLFIPGLVQGAIPVSAQEDPILPDGVRRLIKRQAADTPFCLPLKSRRREEERLLFALAVDSARRQLFLTYPALDIEGSKSNLPSGFLLDFCRVMYGHPVTSEQLEGLSVFQKSVSSCQVDKSNFSRSITNSTDFISNWIEINVPMNLRHLAFRKIYSGRIEAYDRNRRASIFRRDQTAYSAWDGVFLRGESDACQESPEFPVTDLESYAVCPFRYWLQKVLKVTPVEEPELVVEIPPHVIGSIIHKVLEEIYGEVIVGKEIGDVIENIYNIQEIARQKLQIEADSWRRKCPAPQVIWDLAVSVMETRLSNFLRNDLAELSGIKVISTEKRISEDLVFGEGSETLSVKIKGSIDRIDELADGKSIRIIDYKTGSTSTKPEELRGGQRLQLPLYLKAMLKNSSGIDPNSSIAEYVQIKPDGVNKRYGISGQMLVDRDEDLRRILRFITNGITNRYFPPIPEDSNCQSCPVSSACNRLSRMKYFNVTEDSQIEALVSLRGIN